MLSQDCENKEFIKYKQLYLVTLSGPGMAVPVEHSGPTQQSIKRSEQEPMGGEQLSGPTGELLWLVDELFNVSGKYITGTEKKSKLYCFNSVVMPQVPDIFYKIFNSI